MKSYVGIDTSKLHLDTPHLTQSRQVPNTDKAIRSWLKTLPPEAVLVCEASGGYEIFSAAIGFRAARRCGLRRLCGNCRLQPTFPRKPDDRAFLPYVLAQGGS